MPLFTFLCWLFLIWSLGWLSLPLTRRLWIAPALLPDGGLAVGRILLLCLWTLLAFWIGHAGVPVRFSALLVYLFAALLAFGWWREKDELKNYVQNHKRGMVASELIFLVVFGFFFVLRGFWSSIENGEKPMDMALIASCARADYLPPPNPYAAGERLGSYYYLGHLQTALLTDAIGAQPRWTYNLMAAMLPALCFSILASLCGALTGRVRYGAVAAFVVLGLGTQEAWRQWTLRWLQARQGGEAFAWWPINYWDTSRVIPYVAEDGPHYTINEYPWFSFNYADLHAHYFAQPLALLVLCLAWALFHHARAGFAARQWKIVALLGALAGGAQIVTNTWDFPAYFLLLCLALSSFVFWPGWNDEVPKFNQETTFKTPWPVKTAFCLGIVFMMLGIAQMIARFKITSTIYDVGLGALFGGCGLLLSFGSLFWALHLWCSEHPLTLDERLAHAAWRRRFVLRAALSLFAVVILGILSVIAASPFLLKLRSEANPPRALEQPASPLNEWLLVWGTFCAAWFITLWHQARQKEGREKVYEMIFPFGTFVFFLILLSLATGQLCFVVSLLMSLLLWTIVHALSSEDATHVFLCRVALCGLLALLWSETTWAGFLDKPNHRQDTVFKFGLQAWYLLGTAAVCGALRIYHQWAARRPLALPFVNAALVVLLSAPLAASASTLLARARLHIASRAETLQRSTVDAAPDETQPVILNFGVFGFIGESWHGWDAWAHLKPAERETAQWLQNAARDGDNLIEAEQKEGGDYTPYSRYAHATGVPTVIGPQAHAFQWGTSWQEVFDRKNDVRLFYLSGGLGREALRRDLMQKYKVRFIILGELEKQEYGERAVAWLERDLVRDGLSLRLFAENESDPNRVVVFYRAD